MSTTAPNPSVSLAGSDLHGEVASRARRPRPERPMLSGRTRRVYVTLTEHERALLNRYGVYRGQCVGELAYSALQSFLTRLDRELPHVREQFEAEQRDALTLEAQLVREGHGHIIVQGRTY